MYLNGTLMFSFFFHFSIFLLIIVAQLGAVWGAAGVGLLYKLQNIHRYLESSQRASKKPLDAMIHRVRIKT